MLVYLLQRCCRGWGKPSVGSRSLMGKFQSHSLMKRQYGTLLKRPASSSLRRMGPAKALDFANHGAQGEGRV
jgi:hypothetical protein